jgi:hypothetical protein
MRRALLIVAAFAGLVGGGLWAAPRLVPQEALARWFTARAEAALGAELRVTGESRLELLPRPALELGAWRTTTALGPLQAAGARLVFDWRRLARGEAAITAARIDRPTLVVVVPASPRAAAAMLADVVPGAIELEARRGRIVVPGDEDVALRRISVRAQGGRRILAVEARWRGRVIGGEAVLEDSGVAPLSRLELAAGADRLAFHGRLGAEGGAGELELDLADPAALREWLPFALAPPLLDDLARRRRAPLTVRGELAVDGADWRLDAATVQGADLRLAGRLGVERGRLDADLEILEGPAPEEVLAAASERWQALSARLDALDRLALDGAGLRLRLDRAGDGFAASLRASLVAAGDVTVEGRLAAEEPRFEGSLTVVSDDIAAVLPAAVARQLPRPAPLTVSAELAAAPARASLRKVRLTTPQLVFRGRVDLARGRAPALAVAGIIDRLRLPAAALRTPSGRAEALTRLRELARGGGVRVDLDVRRLLFDNAGGFEGRLIAELDRRGLWITAFEAEGPGVGLSLTGGLELAPARLDALGALRVDAPGRLARWLADRPLAALATVPGGRFDIALRGPLDALALELDGRLGALEARFDGTTDLVDANALRGTVALAHPDTGALLTAWGAPPHPSRPLAGPARFEGTVAVDEGWSAAGEATLAGLAGALRAAPAALAVSAVAGPVDDLHAALAALTPWPADLARWRARVQGDWPATPPLATLWPAPFALELAAPDLVAADGGAASLELTLAGTEDTVALDRLRWFEDSRRYELTGRGVRGDRGVEVEVAGTLTDAGEAMVPTALGLGWLGDGEIALGGRLTARGTTPGELVAALDGRLAVEGIIGPSVRRGAAGRPFVLPRLALSGELALARARFDLGALDTGAVSMTGTVDVFADRLAAELRVPADDGGAVALRAHGQLGRPDWHRLAR